MVISPAIVIGFVREVYTVLEDTPGFIDICVEVKNSGMLERSAVVSYTTADETGDMAATSKTIREWFLSKSTTG